MNQLHPDQVSQLQTLWGTMSQPRIAHLLGCHRLTVVRWGKKLGLTLKTGRPIKHGTRSRYLAGCRCPTCLDAVPVWIEAQRRNCRTWREKRRTNPKPIRWICTSCGAPNDVRVTPRRRCSHPPVWEPSRGNRGVS